MIAEVERVLWIALKPLFIKDDNTRKEEEMSKKAKAYAFALAVMSFFFVMYIIGGNSDDYSRNLEELYKTDYYKNIEFEREQEVRKDIFGKFLQLDNVYDLDSTTLNAIFNGPIDVDLKSYLIEKLIGELQSLESIIEYDLDSVGIVLTHGFSGTKEISEISELISVDIIRLKELMVRYRVDSEIFNVILYGDFIDKEIIVESSIRYDKIIIFCVIILLIIGVLIWYSYIVDNKGEKLREIEDIKKAVESAEQEIEKYDGDKSDILSKIKILLEFIKNDLEEYKFEFRYSKYIEKRILQKSDQLLMKSNLMLVFGLIFAAVGILVFYFSLPDLDGNVDNYLLIQQTLRSALILLFLEGLAIYFLKQYRITFKDYTYYYNMYLSKYDLRIVGNVLSKENLNTEDKKVILDFLKAYKYEILEDKEIPNTKNIEMKDILLKLAEK